MSKKIVKNKTKTRDVIGFGTSIARFWKKYFDFHGTAQRSEYWFVFLFVWVVYLFLFGLIGENDWIAVVSVWLFLFFVIAAFIPRLSIGARRLHDAGFSAFWLLSLLIVVPLCVFGTLEIILPVVLDTSKYGYTGAVLETIFRPITYAIYGLTFGYELVLVIIGLLPPRIKNNKYR